MSNPYAPPSVNESLSGDHSRIRRAGYLVIAFGLAIPVPCAALIHGIPIWFIAVVTLIVVSVGIAMVAFSLPNSTRSETNRRRIVWLMIPFLAIVIIGGTLVILSMRSLLAAQQARNEALRAQESAQRAVDQLSRQNQVDKGSESEESAEN